MAVLTIPAQRAALLTFVSAIPGIGNVHDYRRSLKTESEIKDRLFHVGQGRINGWMISLAGSNTTVTIRNPGHHGIGTQGGGNVFTTFQWQIEGYFGHDDLAGSEKTFGDLAWAVADEFNSYGLLNIAGIVQQLPADVEQFGFAMLANFHLVHYARIGVGFHGRTRPT